MDLWKPKKKFQEKKINYIKVLGFRDRVMIITFIEYPLKTSSNMYKE